MPTVDVVVKTPIEKTFHVEQVAGMFDLAVEGEASESFSVELPAHDEDWQIGAIVGPSGSGKTTIARAAFGDCLAAAKPWPKTKAVVDGFGKALIKEITHALTSVGFSSPPAWVKPYHVLSNGEQFRCELARALLSDKQMIAVDEFTSVVDRTVAKIGSAALSKAVRRDNKKFVAISCHYDILDWLEPDWVLDMATGRLERRRLRRPKIKLEIAPVHRCAWELFQRHHYLNHGISLIARCFVAFFEDQPVAFSAWIHYLSRNRRKGDMREHRTVVLPDYQGLGIGNRLSNFCASIWTGIGGRAFSTTSHPAMIRHRSKSPLWNRKRLGRVTRQVEGSLLGNAAPGYVGSSSRVTAGFQYVGPPMDRQLAERYTAEKPKAYILRDSAQQLLDLITAHPGVTVGYLARKSGLTNVGVRTILAELLDDGYVSKAGGPGEAGPAAFYPEDLLSSVSSPSAC